MSATEFYVDGKLVGIAKGVCAEPLKAIGNSATGGRPWSGPIASAMVWIRCLSRAEVAELFGARDAAAATPKP